MLLLPTIAESPGMFPEPAAIRQTIGFREAELAVLRRMLRAAEDAFRLKLAATSTGHAKSITKGDTDATRR